LVLFRRLIIALLLAAAACGAPARAASAPDLTKYEGRTISAIEVALEGVPRDERAEADLRALIAVAPNTQFSAVRVRESLQALFDSGRVANARVEAADAGDAGATVRLRFVVRPQVRVSAVRIELAAPDGGPTADEIRARLNLLETGARATRQVLEANADLIQTYLRDRGFYRAEVSHREELDASGTGTTVTFTVSAGEQARVEAFNLNVAGLDAARVRPQLRLQAGAPFSQAALGEDLERLRQASIAQGNLAPQISHGFTVDSERNLVTVNVTGGVGPRVNVRVTGYEISEGRQRELLPVLREGSIDYSAVEEGRRRLQIRLQEQGHFFAEVTARCAVDAPPPAPRPAAAAPAAAPPPAAISPAAQEPQPGAEDPPPAQPGMADPSCQVLDPEGLSGRTVNILYEVEPGRRFRLTDIDVTGTDALTHEDIAQDLRSQERNVLEFIPFLGYGRGFTSEDALARDARTIRLRMQELGYRRAAVEVRRGVSIDSDDLIITFAVTPGPLTRVAGVEVRGNQIYEAGRLLDEPCSAATLRGEPCTVVGAPYARALARADAERIRGLYARNGYVDSEVSASVVELPAQGGDEQVRIVYDVREGGKVFIDQIIVNGNARTDRQAILEAIPLRPGEPLRLDELRESERILYNTNAFRQVIIRTEPHGETSSGFRKHDVVIDVEELKPRRMDYGGGYSTDGGPLGLFEIQHNNLRGSLRQGTLRARASRLTQLLRLEFFDPRFRAYGQSKFSPLTISAQYQRDVSVTRFFRSTIDRGTFGIVQRLDEEGRPILVECTTVPESECERTGEPTINRFTFNVESQRTLDEASRTVLFVRYNYEDVRIFNFGSLLVAPILRPDRAVRLSRLGATLARDTRDRTFDPTRGEFLTADFALALRQLGGNLSFSKLLTTYRRYWRFGAPPDRRAQILDRGRGGLLGGLSGVGGAIRQTVLAANLNLGLANLFNARDRDGNGMIDDIDRALPISERFFSGGGGTLRGFGFEEAGPRLAVCPGTELRDAAGNLTGCAPGLFRNQEGEQIRLNPFTVPVGGNALAIVNLEARVPVRTNFQIVPFYDGGNVFRRVGDIFGRNDREGTADINQRNLRVQWSHTVGLGLRIKTPVGPLGVDYGFLLNPPEFEVPQNGAPPAIHRLRRGQLHFRFGQTF
jgi:outer membrane protein assembly complex protein YaeT